MVEDQVSGEMKPWMEVAYSLLGEKEIKGGRHNPKIVKLFEASGLKVFDDETPWCDAFVDYCLAKADYTPSPGAMARAELNWEGFEEVDEDELREGDLAVFARPGGGPGAGHVGFFVGWRNDDPESGVLKILGGNQSDMVKISEFSTDSVLGYRRVIE
jgi:uncharacterized protein (TIGR02594 family)